MITRLFKFLFVVGLVMMAGSMLTYPPISITLQISNLSYRGLLFKGVSSTNIHAEVLEPDVVEFSMFVMNQEDLVRCIREGSLVNTSPIASATGESELSLSVILPHPGIYGVVLMMNGTQSVEIHLAITSVAPQWPPLLTGLVLIATASLRLLISKSITYIHKQSSVPEGSTSIQLNGQAKSRH